MEYPTTKVCVQLILISAKDDQKKKDFLGLSLDAVSYYCKTIYSGWQDSLINIQQTTFMYVVVVELNDGKISKLFFILMHF